MKSAEQKAKKVPAIRFVGFDDEWVEKKLSESLILLKDGTHGTHQDAENGPLLLSAKNIKNGSVNWDESDRRISQEEYDQIHSTFNLKKGDVLLTIVGSIGESAVLKNVQGITFQRSVAFLRPNENLLSDYLCTKIRTTSFQKELDNRKSISAQPGIYLGDLSQIPFIIASQKEEQQKIGSFFSNIDSLISLEQKKYDKLTQVKKSMLEKMFPKEGATVPEIRFAGFTGEWDEKKLCGIADRITRKNQNLESNLPLTISAQYGLIDQNEFFDKRIASKDISGYYLVKNGEFAYNKSTSAEAPWGAVKRLDRYEMGVLSTLYIVFGILENKQTDSNYLATYFNTKLWHKEVQLVAAEGARNHGLLNISADDFLQIDIMIPQNLEEQQKIGSYFSHLDSLISLQQRKLEKLKNIKKSLLEKMFA